MKHNTAIHLRCNVGKAKIEKRDGRETIILPSYAAKANTVLNGLFYSKEALAESFEGLDRTPAPMGHPTMNGKFHSARDPEGLVRGFVGAWNERPAWDGDRISINVAVDKERANQSEQGKRLLAAVEAGKPISTSTGLFANVEPAPEGAEYEGVVSGIEWDHVAILLDEDPAIGTDQGVGIYVNGKEEIKVVNSALDIADDQLDWAGLHLLDALERRDRATMWERIKSAIMEAVRGVDGGETSAINTGDADMADEKQLETLSTKVNAIEESLKGLGETVTNAVTEAVKPIKEHVDQIAANQKAKDDEELSGLVEKIVKANLMGEDAAKELTLNAARELAEKAKPKEATALNGAFKGGNNDGPVYKLPKAAEKGA